MTDLSTGLYSHGAIMAALLQRYKTGKGQKIECNLLSTQTIDEIKQCSDVPSNLLNNKTIQASNPILTNNKGVDSSVEVKVDTSTDCAAQTNPVDFQMLQQLC
ncbi:uncharacterized protein LOC144341697 [Saccoglossus kowalevskii]